MHRRLLFSALAAVVVTPLALAALVPACSNQSEGDRCDTRNTTGDVSDDCASTLKCDSYATLGQANTDPTAGVCCPQDRTQATTAACALRPTPAAADAAPAAEAGDDSASPAEAGADAPGDSPAEAAPADASDAG